jgi:hypothetical protein
MKPSRRPLPAAAAERRWQMAVAVCMYTSARSTASGREDPRLRAHTSTCTLIDLSSCACSNPNDGSQRIWSWWCSSKRMPRPGQLVKLEAFRTKKAEELEKRRI